MKSKFTEFTIPAVAAVLLATSSGAGAQSDTVAPEDEGGDWPTYGADLSGSRYRPLDQINASNFNDLEVAWRFKTDSIGPRPEYKLVGTPLEVDGIIYATAGTRRGIVALDAKTGEMMWVHSRREGERGAVAPRQLSGRGLAYWADGDDKRILYVTPGYRLIALDAKTGQPVESFGTNGEVDLKTNFDQEIDLVNGEVGLQSAPVIAGNTIIIGAAFREGFTPATSNNNKGYVRAYDVRTGKRNWIFHTIPQKGEFGYDTWENGSADTTGNTGVWTQVTVDPELNLAYLAVEAATSDFYGGLRRGNNLFSGSLVAVDLDTGERKWHFQMIHHDIWDYDNSSAPLLMDINVEGKPIKAVALPSKQNILYVFDRATGEPVWPIPEVPVPAGEVPGEWYSPTQPIPSKPPAYARNGVTEDELIDFTPELREKALELVKSFKMGPIYTPPVVSKLPAPLGTLNMTASGGTNWPGGSFDPETGIAYVYACTYCMSSTGLAEPPAGMTDLPYVVGVAGQEVEMIRSSSEDAGADAAVAQSTIEARSTPARNAPPRLNIDGLPLLKPPYSVISAIDVNTGTIMWQVPHGDTPDYVRVNPALEGIDIPKTGQPGFQIGTLVTKSLIVAGDGMVTTTPDHPRGALLRAYDKQTGQEVGGIWMPAPQSGSPMTYMVDGKQYLLVAISGGTYSGEYVAYTLPSQR